MSKKYIIKKRYEYISSNGKQFTDWFMFDSTPTDKDTAEEKIKQMKTAYKDIERITKEKHEYTLCDYDEYIKETKEEQKQIEKKRIEEKKYLESDEYRELQRRKRAESRERKQRQKLYKETHGMNDEEKN